MGKKGDLLRAMKDQRTTRTFTEAQLKEHDRQVIMEYFKVTKPLVMKEAAEIDRKRDEDFEKHAHKVWEENAVALISYFLALSSRVLIEQFGWKAPNAHKKPVRVMRYGKAMMDEINNVPKTDKKTLVGYAEETKNLYGVEFNVEDAS